jgi:flagellar hook-length control protein FliK
LAATAVAATAPVAPKATLSKAQVTTQAGTKASDGSETASADSSTATGAASNSIAQQPAAAGKQGTGDDIVGAVKTDAAAGTASIAPATVSAREHSAGTETAAALTDSTDASAQTAATIPQLTSPAAMPAPVGPLSVTTATNPAVPLSGLALEIAASARNGKSSFEIRLDPADLGRIDVRIDVDRNGQVTSHLTVEKPETLSMLRQDAPQLQQALDDAGFKTGSDGLQFSLRDQSSSGQNSGNETGRNAQRLVISNEDTVPAAVAGRTYGRMLGSSGGVDISV